MPHYVWSRRPYRVALLALAALALAACGAQPAAPGPGASAPTESADQSTATPAAPAASPLPTEAPSTAVPVPSETAAVGQRETPGLAATSPAQGGAPSPPATGVTGEVPPELMDRIKADLSARSGVPADAIVELMGQAVEWSDSSLGCPQPDASYLQVITPGYHVMLQAGDATYDYRASENDFLLCAP